MYGCIVWTVLMSHYAHIFANHLFEYTRFIVLSTPIKKHHDWSIWSTFLSIFACLSRIFKRWNCLNLYFVSQISSKWWSCWRILMFHSVLKTFLFRYDRAPQVVPPSPLSCPCPCRCWCRRPSECQGVPRGQSDGRKLSWKEQCHCQWFELSSLVIFKTSWTSIW